MKHFEFVSVNKFYFVTQKLIMKLITKLYKNFRN